MLHILYAVALHIQVLLPTTVQHNFYASTCFGYILYPSSGSNNTVKTQAVYCMSENGKYTNFTFSQQLIDIQYH